MPPVRTPQNTAQGLRCAARRHPGHPGELHLVGVVPGPDENNRYVLRVNGTKPAYTSNGSATDGQPVRPEH